MKALTKLAIAMTVVLGITPAVSAAQARGPLAINEGEPGLLSLATISPAFARLAAFGEFPGSQLVAADIRRQGNRLVYSFDLKFAGREGNELVQIDAATGQVLCVEYTVERDPKRHLAATAPPELVSLVNLSFTAARDAADATAQNGRVLGCKLLVEPTRTVYVFDLEVGSQHVLQQALIDPMTGAVLSTGQPR